MFIGVGLGTEVQPAQRAFSPTQVGDTLLWLDASDPATLFQTVGGVAASADGNPVGSWLDKSGKGNHASNTLTARPTLKTNIYNGRNTLRFDGTNDYLLLPSIGNLGTIDFTAYIVTKVNTPPAWTVIFEQSNAGASNRVVFFVGSGSQIYRYYHNTYVGAGISATSVNRIFKVISNGNNRSYTIDSVAPLSATLADISTTGGITYLGNSVYNEYLTGDISEVIFYNSALSTDQQAVVNTYLKNKWGTP